MPEWTVSESIECVKAIITDAIAGLGITEDGQLDEILGEKAIALLDQCQIEEEL